MTKEYMKEVCESYDFIDGHPAFSNFFNIGVSSLRLVLSEICKNNYSKHSPIFVYPENDRFKEFEESCQKTTVSDSISYLWVHYKDWFGYEWEFDRMEFKLEGGAQRYVKVGDEWMWQSTHDTDLDTYGETYEEAIIEIAKKIKEKYGDFSASEFDSNTVVPQWVVDNNKIHQAHQNFADMFQDGKFVRNEKNVHLKMDEVNEIWWQLHGGDNWFKGYEKIDIEKYLTKENYGL